MRPRPVPITLRSRTRRPDRRALRELVTRCLDGEGAPPARGIGLVLGGDRLLRGLNRRYRGIDRATDVLSFSHDLPPLPPGAGEDEPRLLGEVVVSVPRCLEQAGARELDPGVELVRLTIHGILHLLGYDHAHPAERAKMVPREQRYRRWASSRGIGPGLLRPPGGREP
jgi:probable rRNA maturation factor